MLKQSRKTRWNSWVNENIDYLAQMMERPLADQLVVLAGFWRMDNLWIKLPQVLQKFQAEMNGDDFFKSYTMPDYFVSLLTFLSSIVPQFVPKEKIGDYVNDHFIGRMIEFFREQDVFFKCQVFKSIHFRFTMSTYYFRNVYIDMIRIYFQELAQLDDFTYAERVIDTPEAIHYDNVFKLMRTFREFFSFSDRFLFKEIFLFLDRRLKEGHFGFYFTPFGYFNLFENKKSIM